jgi:hypothetical protein
MSKRYTDRSCLSGKLNDELHRLMVRIFDSLAALENFFRNTFVPSAHSYIDWEQAKAYVCSDVIAYCQSHGSIGLLLENLKELDPDNEDLEELVEYLVAAGYLNDTTAEPIPSSNPEGRDWTSECSFDKVKCAGNDLSLLITQVVGCFSSVASVERFIGENFDNPLGELLLHGLERRQSLKDVVGRLMTDLARIGWSNCFVKALQRASVKT